MTAEDKLIEKRVLLKRIEDSGNFPLNLTRDTHIGTAKKIKSAMIEFADYHVKQALQKAFENADLEHYGDEVCYNKDSIINAYPIENIK